ncbi:uncharacterized protein I303_103620 [Kwoniella dejecticola CBS 10117]|uniref:Uncharacterized protein n=1 Tax=Kwoniella dejecticola CBS 10117 TaxID=1296121 RepID=A0A1A6A793_9TREE|nr:uncharacterized protein I303_03642 [Kwoniella dejecticola CBS 10117]OBR85927.1 hypothetical protein I303_03642 [Kwoniella dejecticola CBS 10117]
MISSITTLLSIVLLLGAQNVRAAICYDGYGRRYYCNGGLAWGARLGIGLGIAVAVVAAFALCGYMRRKQLRNQFSKYRPPALPYSNNNNQQGQNPYVNNPPPPQGYQGQAQSYYGNSNFNGNPYGNNPQPPQQAFQPSMAGQYQSRNDTGVGANNAGGADDHEHGYEWAQAREAERLEREQAAAEGGKAPPGYDVATSAQNTGSNNSTYQPPAGPPPGKTT